MTCFPEPVITHDRYRDSFILCDLLIQLVADFFPRLAFVQTIYLGTLVLTSLTLMIFGPTQTVQLLLRDSSSGSSISLAPYAYPTEWQVHNVFYKSLDGRNPDAVLYLLEFFWAAQHRPAFGASTI